MKRIKKTILLLSCTAMVLTMVMCASLFLPDLPDLVVTEIMLTPEKPYDGDIVTIQATIKNSGKQPESRPCQFQLHI